MLGRIRRCVNQIPSQSAGRDPIRPRKFPMLAVARMKGQCAPDCQRESPVPGRTRTDVIDNGPDGPGEFHSGNCSRPIVN